MLKDKFAVLSVISLLLYAITDFCRNALETAFRVQLIIGSVNHSSSDWAISSKTCQQVLSEAIPLFRMRTLWWSPTL